MCNGIWTDGTYSISMDKDLNGEDLYKSIAFILKRTLWVKTGNPYKVSINVCDSHVSFNIKLEEN